VQLEISGQHHVSITDEMRDRVAEKVEHLSRIFDGITTLRVTFDQGRGLHNCEFVANVSGAPPVVGEVSADTVTAAIDGAAGKVEAQLRKHKDKLRDHRGRASKQQPAQAPVEALEEELLGEEALEEPEESEPWEIPPATE
jgi:putative sigma-54 modulation protein